MQDSSNMNKQRRFHFLGGLLRAGSTPLCNILAHNPRVHATHTGSCIDVMFGVRNNWDKLIEHKAHPNPEGQRRGLRVILKAYYADVDKPVVVGKCRRWASLIEMAESASGRQAKVLVPARDLRDAPASFEKLHRIRSKAEPVPPARAGSPGRSGQVYYGKFWTNL